MNIVDLTNKITHSQALIQQCQNSELYTESEKTKRIEALRIEIRRAENQLREIESKNVNPCSNFKTTY